MNNVSGKSLTPNSTQLRSFWRVEAVLYNHLPDNGKTNRTRRKKNSSIQPNKPKHLILVKHSKLP